MNCMHLFLCRQPTADIHTQLYAYIRARRKTAATQAVMQPLKDIDLIASDYSTYIYTGIYIHTYTGMSIHFCESVCLHICWLSCHLAIGGTRQGYICDFTSYAARVS